MARRVVYRMSSGTLIFMVVYFCTSISLAMETKVAVDCQSDPENMIVQVQTDIPFLGKVYVTQMHDDPECSIKGQGDTTTKIRIPYRGCNTTEKKSGLFLTRITVQQHRLIVSAGDGNYEVGCKMFRGDIQVGSSGEMAVTKQPIQAIPLSTASVAPPEVLLRIYDFENEIFLDTVRLGQVVELEITIRDGSVTRTRYEDHKDDIPTGGEAKLALRPQLGQLFNEKTGLHGLHGYQHQTMRKEMQCQHLGLKRENLQKITILKV